MAFTDAEKTSIRRHLGYNSAAESNYPWIETFHSLNQVLDSAPAWTEDEARKLLGYIENIETELADTTSGALARKKIAQVGELRFNPRELRELRGEINRWSRQLATVLGVPMAGGADGSITVI